MVDKAIGTRVVRWFARPAKPGTRDGWGISATKVAMILFVLAPAYLFAVAARHIYVESLTIAALRAELRGNNQRAVVLGEKAIRLDPSFAAAWIPVREGLDAQGKLADANRLEGAWRSHFPGRAPPW